MAHSVVAIERLFIRDMWDKTGIVTSHWEKTAVAVAALRQRFGPPAAYSCHRWRRIF
jgi:hypothetical protein